MKTPRQKALAPKKRIPLWACFVAWVALVFAFGEALYAYSFKAGPPAAAPTLWPKDVALSRAQHTLVMIAHPHCSCTRASIAELARLMTRLPDTVRAHVVFAVPEGMGPGWERTDLWSSAALVPRAQVHADFGRRLATRFGVQTSGQVLLYAPNDELVFAGGITPSRAHQGDSIGRNRVIELVEHAVTERAVSAVYGCGIHENDASASNQRATGRLEALENK